MPVRQLFHHIGEAYETKKMDFSNVTLANNNANLKIRFRFNGVSMFEDAGKKVFLNSIAIEGVDTALSNDDFNSTVKNLNIYPNPVTNQLQVFAGQIIENVRIFNIFGQLVYSSKAINSESLTVNMSDFSSGLYLVQVSSGNSSSTKKIIKK